MEIQLPFTRFTGKVCQPHILLFAIFLFYLVCTPTHAQETSSLSSNTIRGTVTANNGEPLIGVNIIVEGTDNGTVTDEKGTYSLSVSQGSTIVFSFLGFQSQRVTIDDQQTIDVVLEEEVSALDEVVVIGYGTQRRSDLTGSVAQVGAREINEFPATNVLQSLSGRAAGVQVSPTTGAPGAGLNVRIRGTNSIQGSNEPLYVVDGFPIFGSNPTLLNNTDIESIEVLKDASATAIYGSRGANGVVLITTRQGVSGETRVDLDLSYGQQELRHKLNLMNAEEYARLYNIQAANDNIAPYFSQEEITRFGQGFDWQDFVFREAPMQTATINVNGGSDNTQFSVSGSYFGQDGIIKGSDYDRYSFRTNVNQKVSEKFRVTLSSTFSHLKTSRRDSDGGARGNSLIGAAISAAPTLSPYNGDGSYTVLANAYPFVAPDIINPINFINEQSHVIKANLVLANAAVHYNPIPDLTIKISGGIENRDDRTDSYTSTNFINSNGAATVSTSQFRSLLNENTITYSKTFNEKHDFSAVAGVTLQNFRTTFLSGSGSGYLSDISESHDLGAAENPGIPTSGYNESVLLSYLGRLNYSFNKKYLFTISFRSDGSSKYSEGNKWGYFPSGAVAWRLSEENFLKNNRTISDLKIRASWGKTGSQAIDAYATLNQLMSGKTVFGQELYTTFAPGTRLPGDLKWETTEQTDFGLDLGLFNNRILLTADYYIKNTSDLLNTVTLPSTLGFTTTIQNVGEVQNKGFELGVDANVLNGNFKWDVVGNFSLNRNKVVKLSNGEDILGAFVDVIALRDNINILREGRPIGQFWGYVEDGYDENGRIKYQDLNNDGAISAEDKTYIGDPNPKYMYGLNSIMSFKNFDLTLFFQGMYGNDIFNLSSVSSTMDYSSGVNMPKEVLEDHWSPTNTDAKYPVISRNTSIMVSDRYVEDGSYLRLKNIQIAYNFPVQNLGIDWLYQLQVYVSGQNLWTSTNYSWWDPEVNSRGGANSTAQGIDHYSYPTSKTYTLGIRAGF
ncbi:MAG TPA: TonB-dependent receptor [Cyclobacteriaceae bacterium]|nr:TonB-dependent receptor [Cyclobacteriaceae bacterium]